MKSSAMNSSCLKTVLTFRYLLLGMLSPPKKGQIQCELTSLFINAHFTEKRFFWVWHRPARPSTHNTWNGGNNNNGGVNNNQNTGGGNGGSNSWTGGNGNNGPVSNNQQGDVPSPGKFNDSKAT